MLTLNSSATILNVLAGKSAQPESLNEDVIAHQMETPPPAPEAFPLRLLPGFLRRPLKAWIAARAYERSLIRVWNVSPHLLNDMGIVLTDNGKLPDYLTAAPARVIDHIADAAPDQIVAAELSFPPAEPARAAAQAAETAKVSRSGERFSPARAV